MSTNIHEAVTPYATHLQQTYGWDRRKAREYAYRAFERGVIVAEEVEPWPWQEVATHETGLRMLIPKRSKG